jgi:RNA polymerase sigma-70 factor (ECF subfamily)
LDTAVDGVAAHGQEACDLAQRAGLGDTQAFEALIEPFRSRLLNLLRSMVRTAADAEEVLQQALLQIHLGLPRLGRPKNDRMLSAWIFRVAVNAGLMHLRTKRRRPVLHLEDLPARSARHDTALWPTSGPLRRPDERLLQEEMTARLHLAIDALPDKYRLVLWLRDIEEQSNDEVANTLGLTVPTVKARLHRARRVVRGALSPYVNELRQPTDLRSSPWEF